MRTLLTAATIDKAELRWSLAGVLLAALAGGLAVLQTQAALLLACACLVAVGCLLLFLRPFLGILCLFWLVPLHSLILAGLLSVGSIPDIAISAFQAWKVGLLLLLLFRLWRPSRRRWRLTWLDLAIGLVFVFEGVYFFLPLGPSLSVRLFAIQFDSLFLLFYVLGRLFPFSQKQFRMIVVSLLVVGWIAAAFAIVEATVLGGFLYKLPAYFTYLGKDISRSLPIQFYTFIGGIAVQRPGSIYLNPIELAFALLLPLGISWGLGLNNGYRPATRLWLGLLLMLGALFLTLSRSAMLGLGVGVILILVLRPRMPRWFLIAGGVLVLVALILALVLRLDQLLIDTVNIAEPSAAGHALRWQLSIQTMSESPLGLGLGSIGPVARRFVSADALINESWYFQLATEMGIPAGLLFAVIMLLMIMGSLRVWRQMPDRFLRGTTLGFVAATAALAFSALFLHTWSYDAAAFPFWLLAGLIIQLPERVQAWSRAAGQDEPRPAGERGDGSC